MRILVLGSGLIGPAAAFNAMSDPDVSQVTLCDISQQALEVAQAKLEDMAGSEKLTTALLDVRDQETATRLMAGFDAILGALPPPVIPACIRAAVAAGTPLVDLLWPTDAAERAELKQLVEGTGSLVLVGCGVEPGLTEIVARYLADRLDRVDELHIKCGGVPEKPAPPLGYKIVFGGRDLPLREGDSHVIDNGEYKAVPRFSGVEKTSFAGVGECEAYNEDFFPWLLELEALKDLQSGSQKTCRWPGYAAKAALLRDLGLIRQDPVDVDGVKVVPKALLNALLYPHVKLEEGERDITLFRVEAAGEEDGRPQRYKIEMVDRYDKELGFTSMARTTGFTGAIIARLVARGELKARGMFTPEQVITGPPFDRLVGELAAADVRFNLTAEKVKALA